MTEAEKTAPHARTTDGAGADAKSAPSSRLVRLSLIGLAVGLIGAAFLAPGSFLRNTIPEPDIDPLDFAGRTAHILQTTPLIDGHNDLPYLLRIELKNKINDATKFTFRDSLASHTDLARLRQGRVGGQFWSVFVECPPETASLDDPNYSVRDTLEQIDVTKRFIAAYPDALAWCSNSTCTRDEFVRTGRIASMLGAEGMHQAGSSIGVLRELFELGVRYITVTHNCDNAFATAASTVTAGGEDRGLSDFGWAGITEMNRLGMMVDLAHVSHRTMRDVLDIAKAPVIFSHAACYALAKNYRNVPDDVIRRMKENGGVLMVFFVKRFLNEVSPDVADVETVVDHIMHVVELAGWEHVGIGGDFDGTVTLAEGIESVADYPKLIEAVLKRGATDEQVRGLVGGNILRVWQRNEEVATELADMLPVEEVWEGRTFSRWNNPLPIMIPGNPGRVTAKEYP